MEQATSAPISWGRVLLPGFPYFRHRIAEPALPGGKQRPRKATPLPQMLPDQTYGFPFRKCEFAILSNVVPREEGINR